MQGVLAAGVAGEKGGQKINSPPSKESDTDYENAGFAVGRKSRAESLSENATPRYVDAPLRTCVRMYGYMHLQKDE
jgi:hypothetical protein